MMESEVMIEERKEKIFGFFKQKYNLIIYPQIMYHYMELLADNQPSSDEAKKKVERSLEKFKQKLTDLLEKIGASYFEEHIKRKELLDGYVKQNKEKLHYIPNEERRRVLKGYDEDKIRYSINGQSYISIIRSKKGIKDIKVVKAEDGKPLLHIQCGKAHLDDPGASDRFNKDAILKPREEFVSSECVTIFSPIRSIRNNPEVKNIAVALTEGENDTKLKIEFNKERKYVSVSTNKDAHIAIVYLNKETNEIEYLKKKEGHRKDAT